MTSIDNPLHTTHDVSTDLEVREVINQFKTARRATAMWRDRESELREKLLKLFNVNHLGHWEITFHGRTILKIDRREFRRFQPLAFKEDHPELYEKYRDASVSDVITTAGTGDPDVPPTS